MDFRQGRFCQGTFLKHVAEATASPNANDIPSNHNPAAPPSPEESEEWDQASADNCLLWKSTASDDEILAFTRAGGWKGGKGRGKGGKGVAKVLIAEVAKVLACLRGAYGILHS